MLQISISCVRVNGKNRQVATFNGEALGKGKAPFLSACRKLIEMGYSEGERVQCSWLGSNVVSFDGTLGQFAKWTVSENERIGPKLVKWEPFDEAHRQA